MGPQGRRGTGNLCSKLSLPVLLSLDSGKGYTDNGGTPVPPPQHRSPDRMLYLTQTLQLLTSESSNPRCLPAHSPLLFCLCWTLLHEPTPERSTKHLMHLLVLSLSQSVVEHSWRLCDIWLKICSRAHCKQLFTAMSNIMPLVLWEPVAFLPSAAARLCERWMKGELWGEREKKKKKTMTGKKKPCLLLSTSQHNLISWFGDRLENRAMH